MEIKQEKDLIQQILSESPEDVELLIEAGVVAEQQEISEDLYEGEEVLAEDAEYLESLSDEELEELAASYDEVFASLEREGCGDLAELLYAALFHSET